MLGKYPQEGILWLLEQLNLYLGTILPNGMLHDFLSNGVVNGVGNVLAFLPNILILFFFMYMFEESGYLTHVAALLDNMMHKIGLHGNSAVPLLMGFGCNVPAILATKTIPDTKRRILTMLLIPFMSCSARLPILVLLVGAFFPQHPILIIFGLYGITIVMAILTAFFLDRVFFKTELDLTPVEVLPLQKPKIKKVLLLTWDAGYEYLKKIGTVVLIAMMVIWFLSHFPQNNNSNLTALQISPNEALGTVTPGKLMSGCLFGKPSTGSLVGISGASRISYRPLLPSICLLKAARAHSACSVAIRLMPPPSSCSKPRPST